MRLQVGIVFAKSNNGDTSDLALLNDKSTIRPLGLANTNFVCSVQGLTLQVHHSGKSRGVRNRPPPTRSERQEFDTSWNNSFKEAGMNKVHLNWFATAVLAAAYAVLATAPASAQKKYDPGASDTEIKIGQTMPFSGPASAYATIGNAAAAYFRMINDQGGINGRKINLIAYDDSYNPAKTVEKTRKLVESDSVLLMFGSLGTAPNAAVQKYLNDNKVPQLFVATGAARFSDPANFPWTMSASPSYQTEGRIYGHYILANHPDARIGILYQNDDLGKDYLIGLKQALGAKAASMIVAEAPYETTDPTVDSQIVRLKSAGADLFYNVSTPKFAAQAIRKIAELGWKPVHILANVSSSVGGVLKPAGFEASQGIVSVNFIKDPGDPVWVNDPGMMKWRAFMDKYYPAGDKNSSLSTSGYGLGQLLELVLRNCGDNLTRESVMKQASSMKDIQLDLSLPGTAINTSPTDYRVIKQLEMVRFEGERWVNFGPIISDDYRD
jgi:branched-chain amino acid transport system substrate-binding protein